MRLTRALAAASAVLVIAGCGGTAESEDDTESAEQSQEASEAQTRVDEATDEVEITEPLAEELSDPADLSDETIYYIPFSLQIAYFNSEFSGLRDGLEAAGATVRSCDGGFTPSGIEQCIDQAIGGGATAVVTSAVDYQIASGAFNRLSDNNIPTLLAQAEASDVSGEIPDGLEFNGIHWHQHEAAELTAQKIIADSNAEANVLYLRITDTPPLIRQGDAGISALEEQCENCEVTVEDIHGPNADQIPSQVSGILLNDPTIDYIIPQTDAFLTEAITGVQDAGMQTQVRYGVANGTLAGLQQVSTNDDVLVTTGASPHFVGWAYADAAVRMLTGHEVPDSYPSVVRLFDETNIEQLELTPDAEMTNQWYGPDTYTDDFLELWGVE